MVNSRMLVETLLHSRCQDDVVDSVEELGRKLRGREIIRRAINEGEERRVSPKLLLLLACYSKDLALVKKYWDLVKNNNEESDGFGWNAQMYPIHFVCQFPSIPVLSILLQDNESAVLTPDEEGFLPLHWACQTSHLEVVQFLLEKGGPEQIHVKDSEGCLPTHSACTGDNPAILDCLLEQGGIEEIMQPCGSGLLPLDYACYLEPEDTFERKRASERMVQTLLQRGDPLQLRYQPEKGGRMIPIQFASRYANSLALRVICEYETNLPLEPISEPMKNRTVQLLLESLRDGTAEARILECVVIIATYHILDDQDLEPLPTSIKDAVWSTMRTQRSKNARTTLSDQQGDEQ